jgi:Asp-tRNA(Asn)/Glu-tRNA(Gln) amidotransferase B subunit
MSGKTAVLGFLVGKAMKESKGQADPVKVKQALERKLKEPPEA